MWRSCYTVILEAYLGAEHPYTSRPGIHVCRVAVHPETRRYMAVGCLCTLLPAGVGCPCSLSPGDRRQGVTGTPSPAGQGRGAARQVSGAAIIPTQGRTWEREGKGLALGPMTLKDSPSGSHSPPHGRAAGPARQLPRRAGRHFARKRGGGGLRGGAS